MDRPARIFLKSCITLVLIVLFGALFFVGSFWPFVRLWALINNNWVTHLFGSLIQATPVWKRNLTPPRYLIINGLVFGSVLFLLLLLMEAVVKRLRPYLALTTLAFVLALLFDLWQKLGLVTPS